MTPACQQEIERLFREFGKGIGSYVLARIGDAELAEEITARVFLQVVRSYDQLRGPALPWLWAIARNELARHFRTSFRLTTFPDDLADHRPGPDETLERDEASARLREALESLAEDEREIIALKFFLRRSNQEIAATMKISASLVGVRVYRLLRELRGVLELPSSSAS